MPRRKRKTTTKPMGRISTKYIEIYSPEARKRIVLPVRSGVRIIPHEGKGIYVENGKDLHFMNMYGKLGKYKNGIQVRLETPKRMVIQSNGLILYTLKKRSYQT